MKLTKKYLSELSYEIIGCAIEVHRELGPGLLEQVYHKCLHYEFELRKLFVRSQVMIPVTYKDVELDAELKFDFLVNDLVIVEIKSVDRMIPVYDAQLLTYMKMLSRPKGLLINFNSCNIASEGVKSMVNGSYSALPES